MQRFSVALFAFLAVLAVLSPFVDARSTSVHRRETNAQRLRRGEAILPPAKLRRHDEPSYNQPGGYPYGGGQPKPSATMPGKPTSTGSVQCRGGDGQTIGYIGKGWTVGSSSSGSGSGSSSGLTCSYANGLLQVIDETISESSSIFGAVAGSLIKKGSSSITGLLGTSSSENVVSWALDASTGLLTPSYKNSDGSTSSCSVLYDENSRKLSLSAEKSTGVEVKLYLV